MTYTLTDADTARIRQLIEHSDLDGIVFHEQSARRHEDTPAGSSHESNAEVGIQFRLADQDFGVRIMAEIQNEIGSATVVVSAEYKLSDDYHPSRRDVMMFANEVAVMTVFPFLREGISDATLKVFGTSILLPIAPRGAIGFQIDPATELD